MCGIACYIVKEGEFPPPLIEACIKILYAAQDHRGGHGAGMGYFTRDAFNFPTIYKGIPPVKSNIFSNEFNKILKFFKKDQIQCSYLSELILQLDKSFVVYNTPVIAHTRFTTVGNNVVANTHPFYFSNEKEIIFVHNGTVLNFNEIKQEGGYPNHLQTDSHVLGHAVSMVHLEKIYKQINGAATMVWTESSSNDIFLIGNSQDGKSLSRTLYFLLIPGKAVFVSSTFECLNTIRFVLSTKEVNYTENIEIYSIPINTLMSVGLEKFSFLKTLTAPPVVKKETTNQYSKAPSKIISEVRNRLTIANNRLKYPNTLVNECGIFFLNKIPLTTAVNMTTGKTIKCLNNYFNVNTGRVLINSKGEFYESDRINNKTVYTRIDPKDAVELYFFKGILVNKAYFYSLISNEGDLPKYISVRDLADNSPFPVPIYLYTQSTLQAVVFLNKNNEKLDGNPVIYPFSNLELEFTFNCISNITEYSRQTMKWDFSFLRETEQ